MKQLNYEEIRDIIIDEQKVEYVDIVRDQGCQSNRKVTSETTKSL